jgi:hypothetical protein
MQLMPLTQRPTAADERCTLEQQCDAARTMISLSAAHVRAER